MKCILETYYAEKIKLFLAILDLPFWKGKSLRSAAAAVGQSRLGVPTALQLVAESSSVYSSSRLVTTMSMLPPPLQGELLELCSDKAGGGDSTGTRLERAQELG